MRELSEREIWRSNYRKLRALGIIKYQLDGRPKEVYKVDESIFSKVTFSKNYHTYDDYKEDLEKILDIGMEGKEIPGNLFNKLMEAKMKVDD